MILDSPIELSASFGFVTAPLLILDAVIALSLKPYMDIVMMEKQMQTAWYLPVLIVLFTSFQIWAAPWFVILFGVYVILCEFVSVLENTRGKQGAKLITDMIIKIMTSKGDKDKMVDALSDAVNETSVEAKPVKPSKTKKKSSVEG